MYKNEIVSLGSIFLAWNALHVFRNDYTTSSLGVKKMLKEKRAANFSQSEDVNTLDENTRVVNDNSAEDK